MEFQKAWKKVSEKKGLSVRKAGEPKGRPEKGKERACQHPSRRPRLSLANGKLIIGGRNSKSREESPSSLSSNSDFLMSSSLKFNGPIRECSKVGQSGGVSAYPNGPARPSMVPISNISIDLTNSSYRTLKGPTFPSAFDSSGPQDSGHESLLLDHHQVIGNRGGSISGSVTIEPEVQTNVNSEIVPFVYTPAKPKAKRVGKNIGASKCHAMITRGSDKLNKGWETTEENQLKDKWNLEVEITNMVEEGYARGQNMEVVFCNIYAASVERERRELWGFLLSSQSSFLMPWCIGGDFNTVLHPSERKGGIYNMSFVNSFNAFVLQARVVDLPLTGFPFTWTNLREKDSWARLNHFLISPEILSWFPKLIQTGHLGSLSDHSAVSIGEPQMDWGPCPFRFYNGWLEDKVMMNDVMSGWRRNRASSSVLECEIRLSEVEKQALRVGWGEELRQKRATIIQKYWKYIRFEEQIWRQKSRVKRLKDSDKNSRIGKSVGFQEDWASVFRCKKGFFPLNCLGLPLGARPGTKSFWKDLVSCVESRLAPWKKKFLSKGGRLVFIKAVMSGIPTYYMSVFKMPVGVALAIENLQRNFFLGDRVEKRKTHSVDWATICKNKKIGGLGVGRMKDKNMSLLAKWVWHFGREETSIWKRVICAKYGRSTKDLSWDWNFHSSSSYFTNAIQSLFVEGFSTEKILKDGLRMLVGNGDRIKFLTDLYWDSKPLNQAFARIYALSQAKDGRMKEVGMWNDSKWVWNFSLRRPLFDWEIDVWKEFLSSLDSLNVRRLIPDVIAWSMNPNGIFLVGSFRRCLDQEKASIIPIFDPIWRGYCPPKVELFLWQLIRGRVMVKEVWKAAMVWWEVEFCASRTINDWFLGWSSLNPLQCIARAWQILFLAVVWSLWEARNSRIFKNSEVLIHQVVDMVRFRLVWWFKHYCKGSKDQVSLMFLNVKDCCVDLPIPKKSRSAHWRPPQEESLLFNVDGSALGAPVLADSISVELLAIHKACDIIQASKKWNGVKVVILSDSLVAVSWVNGEDVGSLEHADIIFEIRNWLKLFSNLVVSYASRCSNFFVDSLAKQGARNCGDFMQFMDS
ncbi:hypothetical protein Dsin_009067 [Dipteronia sinensis]|uniref:RNase H type-1 domain-containing protein n=1 Tax=Dipteronia sinensis TaxID=43782 RepID=A0AAE0AR39_9ROSI|nr:hypothetical protein Dsin_009067 [Dipteronia sinensis]